LIALPSWIIPVETRRPRRRVRLIDDRFERASAFVTEALTYRDHRWRLLGYAIRNVRGLVTVVWVVSRLPWLSVTLSNDQSGATVREMLASPRDGSRQIAMAVLDLPESGATYPVGRPRQALRTNARRAATAGVVCHDLPAAHERRRHFAEMLARDDAARFGPNWLEEGAVSRVLRCYAATTADGKTLAVAAVVVDGEWAVLTCFLRHPDRAEAGDARYLLQDHLVDDLAGVGVRHLAVDSALRVSAGLRYFQHLVGFRPVNLHVDQAPVALDPTPPSDEAMRHHMG
jgi:hypothetical protein